MASKRMKRRAIKRAKCQRWELRENLRNQMKDPNVDVETKFEILEKLEKMPRDSSHVRVSRRCRITGRVRGTLRKFGICRNKLRELAMSGEVPGLVKASW